MCIIYSATLAEAWASWTEQPLAIAGPWNWTHTTREAEEFLMKVESL